MRRSIYDLSAYERQDLIKSIITRIGEYKYYSMVSAMGGEDNFLEYVLNKNPYNTGPGCVTSIYAWCFLIVIGSILFTIFKFIGSSVIEWFQWFFEKIGSFF